jgi:hypothetical protein
MMKSGSDKVFTPELVRILKIFLLSSLALVLVLSFFNEHRANNSGEDRTFRVADSNRIYFRNVRSIYYDREVRSDAGMVLYRHGKRMKSETTPTLDPMILLNSAKDDAYIYFELANGEWPIQIVATRADVKDTFDLDVGNNHDHFNFFNQLLPELEQDAEFELIVDEKVVPLWQEEKEKEAVKTVAEDYLRLLSKTN